MAAKLRLACRSGLHVGPTAGYCPGSVQANLVMLPQAGGWAKHFHNYCLANPAPCPIIEVVNPSPSGGHEPLHCASGADLRTDLPRYRIWSGQRWQEDEPSDVTPFYDNLVCFLLGCSFSFDAELVRCGLPVRHEQQGKNVPMFITTLPTTPCGPFGGPLVVSMRPMTLEQAERATEITTEFPHAHGPPVHVGTPEAIGVLDLMSPDYGDAVTIHPGEVPVFWACGVTPQRAIEQACPPLAIVHAPGHMFICD